MRIQNFFGFVNIIVKTNNYNIEIKRIISHFYFAILGISGKIINDEIISFCLKCENLLFTKTKQTTENSRQKMTDNV